MIMPVLTGKSLKPSSNLTFFAKAAPLFCWRWNLLGGG